MPSCLEPGGIIQDVDHWVRDQHVQAIVYLIGLDADEFEIADLLRAYYATFDVDMLCAVTVALKRFGISSYQMNKWMNLVRPEEKLNI